MAAATAGLTAGRVGFEETGAHHLQHLLRVFVLDSAAWSRHQPGVGG